MTALSCKCHFSPVAREPSQHCVERTYYQPIMLEMKNSNLHPLLLTSQACLRDSNSAACNATGRSGRGRRQQGLGLTFICFPEAASTHLIICDVRERRKLSPQDAERKMFHMIVYRKMSLFKKKLYCLYRETGNTAVRYVTDMLYGQPLARRTVLLI